LLHCDCQLSILERVTKSHENVAIAVRTGHKEGKFVYHNYNTRAVAAQSLTIYRMYNNYGKYNINSYAPKLWNDGIPDSIKANTSASIFSKQYKLYLKSEAGLGLDLFTFK